MGCIACLLLGIFLIKSNTVVSSMVIRGRIRKNLLWIREDQQWYQDRNTLSPGRARWYPKLSKKWVNWAKRGECGTPPTHLLMGNIHRHVQIPMRLSYWLSEPLCHLEPDFSSSTLEMICDSDWPMMSHKAYIHDITPIKSTCRKRRKEKKGKDMDR